MRARLAPRCICPSAARRRRATAIAKRGRPPSTSSPSGSRSMSTTRGACRRRKSTWRPKQQPEGALFCPAAPRAFPMIEIARQSRPRGLSRAATLLVVAAAAAVLASVLVLHRGHARHALPTAPSHPHERPALRASVASARWSTAVDRALANESRAVGLHLFTSSTGGAPAAAVRVAHWRPLIVRATRGSGFSPRLLEALVALESGGRAGAVAGSDPAAATGLTGLTAERARGFLHMHVDLRASRRLTLLIRRAEARHRSHRVRVLEARRRRADRRFVPLASLLGAVRDLEDAQRLLGQRDLAV